MIKLNENYLKLGGSYLFNEIKQKIEIFKIQNPNKKIINASIGDCTLPLGKSVVEKMSQAVLEQANIETFKGYPETNGYRFFKEQIAKYYLRFKVSVDINDLFVIDGAKSSLFFIISQFNKSDILIQNPSYPVYNDCGVLCGNNVIYFDEKCQNPFLLSNLEKKSYVIILCSPNNPTGLTLSKETLKNWVDFANQTNSLIIYDNAYESYIDGDYPRSIYEIKGATNCAIEVSSLSKNAGFTGVRLGWIVIPNGLCYNGVKIKQIFNRMINTVFNGVSYIQCVGGTQALTDIGIKEWKVNVEAYKNYTKKLANTLKKVGFEVCDCSSSPYVWAKCPSQFDDSSFFEYMLNNYGVVVTRGSGFGSGGANYFRLSGFCLNEELDYILSTLSF